MPTPGAGACGFITQGQRQEAELALKLLQGKVDATQLARYEERIRAL